MYKLMKSISL